MTPAAAVPATLRAVTTRGERCTVHTVEYSDHLAISRDLCLIHGDYTNGRPYDQVAAARAVAVAMLPDLIAMARGVAAGVTMTETARQLVARLDAEVPS